MQRLHISLSATSEFELYLRFARATGLPPPTDRFTRATTEDSALDSFQNVLFSICRFRKLTDTYSPSSAMISNGVASGNSTIAHRAPFFAPLVDQCVHAVLYRPVWLPRAPGPEARGIEFPRKGPRIPRRSVRQKCASCWSGVQGMARGSFLISFHG
ncbi:hypothetical protein EDB89DRAFT_478543 [Lactarius sanguifluus]|nr:hypothetical protein EDB89DRAFT_478543 [Lactarius sanguifluus]